MRSKKNWRTILIDRMWMLSGLSFWTPILLFVFNIQIQPLFMLALFVPFLLLALRRHDSFSGILRCIRYHVAFPFVLVGKIVLFGMYKLRVILSIFRAFKNLWMYMVYCIALLVVNVCLVTIHHDFTSVILANAAIFINYVILFISLYYSIRPLSGLDALNHLIESFLNFASNRDLINRKEPDSLARVEYWKTIFHRARQICEMVHKRMNIAIALVFFLAILVATSTTVFTYGVIYFSLNRSQYALFSGIESFPHSAAFSFSVFSTSPFPNVATSTQYENIIIASELACTVVAITILISVFSIGVGLQQSSIVKFGASIAHFQDWLRHLEALYMTRHRFLYDKDSQPSNVVISATIVHCCD